MPEQKINVVLIEKNQTEVKTLQSLLESSDKLSVIGTATNGTKGFSLIIKYSPQLVFVNVDLQDINGLEFVRMMQNQNIFPEIVFIANDEHSAYDTLHLEPLDFWVKPIQKKVVDDMLDRLKQKLIKKELIRKMDVFAKSYEVLPKRVFRQKSGIVVLELSEIVFIKASLIYSVLTLVNGQELTLRTSLSQTVETINNENFVPINRSYCINRKYLKKTDKRKQKCYLQFEDITWEVPASKNMIRQLEKLDGFPVN